MSDERLTKLEAEVGGIKSDIRDLKAIDVKIIDKLEAIHSSIRNNAEMGLTHQSRINSLERGMTRVTEEAKVQNATLYQQNESQNASLDELKRGEVARRTREEVMMFVITKGVPLLITVCTAGVGFLAWYMKNGGK